MGKEVRFRVDTTSSIMGAIEPGIWIGAHVPRDVHVLSLQPLPPGEQGKTTAGPPPAIFHAALGPSNSPSIC